MTTPHEFYWNQFTFVLPENGRVTFGVAEFEQMSVDELRNFCVLIDVCRTTNPTSELVQILGKKLLPRFFVKEEKS